MTGPTIPMLTDELLRSALAVPAVTRAPRELRDTIVTPSAATAQRPARSANVSPDVCRSSRRRPACCWWRAPLLLIVVAIVAGRLLGPPPAPFVESLRGRRQPDRADGRTRSGWPAVRLWHAPLGARSAARPPSRTASPSRDGVGGGRRSRARDGDRQRDRGPGSTIRSTPAIAGDLILMGRTPGSSSRSGVPIMTRHGGSEVGGPIAGAPRYSAAART